MSKDKTTKKRAYKRQALKKQYTVRIDKELAEAVIVRGENEGLRLTDVMEDGLQLWLQRVHDCGPILRGRFLWNVIPQRLHRPTLALWTFLMEPNPKKPEDTRFRIVRSFVEKWLEDWEEDERHGAGLARLGRPPSGGPDESSQRNA